MAILIKGWDKPTCCRKCPFFHGPEYVEKSTPIVKTLTDLVNDDTYVKTYKCSLQYAIAFDKITRPHTMKEREVILANVKPYPWSMITSLPEDCPLEYVKDE